MSELEKTSQSDIPEDTPLTPEQAKEYLAEFYAQFCLKTLGLVASHKQPGYSGDAMQTLYESSLGKPYIECFNCKAHATFKDVVEDNNVPDCTLYVVGEAVIQDKVEAGESASTRAITDTADIQLIRDGDIIATEASKFGF